MAHLRFIASTLIVSLLMPACAVNPVSGSRELALMSEADEIRVGAENDPKIKKQYGTYPNQKLQATVERLGQTLAKHSHRANLTYHFTVLDSDEVNAFALPGGYVYVTRGILAYLNSEAEVAAVLGHEIGHVTARHGARQYSAAVAANVGAGLLSVFVPGLGNQAGQSLLNVLGNALLSGYGRDHELESDRLGAQYLARAGYDPDAMIKVIGVLKNQEEFEKKRAEKEGREPRIYHGVFASHPSADKRLQEVVAAAHQYRTSASARTGREEFLNLMDGVTFGESELQGVRRGNRFYHKTLNFMLAFPEGFGVENRPDVVRATSPDKRVIMELRLETLQKNLTPKDFIRSKIKFVNIRNEQSFDSHGFSAHTILGSVITSKGPRDLRATALVRDNQMFSLIGFAETDAILRERDSAFLATAKSLRGMTLDEKNLGKALKLRVIIAKPGDTFAALAKDSPLPEHAEWMLRLLNDKFPTGEPKPGERIKIVQ
jgi:predicted Zn-dependent protease